MKKLLFLLLFVSEAALAQRLDGAYKITGGQYGAEPLTADRLRREQIVKIFKDGYWICAYYGDPKKPFNGTCGGRYKTENGKYIETLDFYSWDSTAVGKTYTFNYRLAGDRYEQEGRMDSKKYPNYVIKEAYKKIGADVPLKDASLEGMWLLQGATWIDSTGREAPLERVQQVKIYAYPLFAWAQYNPATKQFVGAGGGTYRFDGKSLVEHIHYTTYDTALGSDYAVDVKRLSDGTILQTAWEGRFKETWKRAK